MIKVCLVVAGVSLFKNETKICNAVKEMQVPGRTVSRTAACTNIIAKCSNIIAECTNIIANVLI